MSKFLEQLLEIQNANNSEMDFHVITAQMLELIKRNHSENSGGYSSEELKSHEQQISFMEEELKKSFQWFPIQKIKEGLNRIEADPKFEMIYTNWQEIVLLRFYRFASRKFFVNILERVYPSPDIDNYGSQLEAKFDFMNKIVRSSDKKGSNFAKNDLFQIIESNGLAFELTKFLSDYVGAMQKDGVPIAMDLRDKVVNAFGEKYLGLDMDFMQKEIFDGILDEIGTKKKGRKGESTTYKCKLLWLLFIHTHPKAHTDKGIDARTADEINRDSLLRIISLRQ